MFTLVAEGNRLMRLALVPLSVLLLAPLAALDAAEPPASVRQFVEEHCIDCHDADSKQGGLDFTALESDLSNVDAFARWVRVHDRVRDGEMPPKSELSPKEREELLRPLGDALNGAERKHREGTGRAALRRLNKTEYENTLRDLLGIPALRVAELLPEDGRAHGYNKGGPALEFSTVQIAKYMEAVDRALNVADPRYPIVIARFPEKPQPIQQRVYPLDYWASHLGVWSRLFNGDVVCLKDYKHDTEMQPLLTAELYDAPLREAQQRIYKMGLCGPGPDAKPYTGAIGFLRHDGGTGSAELGRLHRFQPAMPGYYRLRVSAWSFLWDKGEVKPAPATQIASLQVDKVRMGGGENNGRILVHCDAPSLKPKVTEVVAWLNAGDGLVFIPDSMVTGSYIPSRIKGNLSAYQNVGIAIDWMEAEGPLVDEWPTIGHKRLFGDLPLAEFDPKSGLKVPARRGFGHTGAHSAPFPITPDQKKTWTVAANDPVADAKKRLEAFLPLVFRRTVKDDEVTAYLAIALERLGNKATFEEALLTACKAALCSPEFLYLKEPAGPLDDFALASRLSYFLWNSMPDEELLRLAGEKKLRDPQVLREQTERMLNDPKGERFVADFTDQWLDLRLIDENTPHSGLYPEFRALLRDAMQEEPRAFLRELLKRDLPVRNVVRSEFAMLNQPLADFYGPFDFEDYTIAVENPRPKQPREQLPKPVTTEKPIEGWEFRPVSLTEDSQRGGLLTMAAVLKVTANGTTTSPVKRGAWVQRKIAGKPPEPPPPNVPAVEPDTRGATTIREILDKHRADVSCAACHRSMDPPGFALESYDPIGRFRARYRVLEEGDRVHGVPRSAGAQWFHFKLGLPVDASGQLANDRSFADIREFRELLLSDERQLARNLARHLIVYATGTPVGFADRPEVESLLDKAKGSQYGVRSLIHAVIQSPLFLNR